MKIFDSRRCLLGEGALWHPMRRELFWFDINAHKLLSQSSEWHFDEYVSAAGWVSRDELLIASQTQLFRFNVQSAAQSKICDLEHDKPHTRSNDGRADPQGGFWIGTMGIKAEPDAGAIYRYYRGNLVKLQCNMTIPNAICFSPQGNLAYYADTPTKKIMSVALDKDGWPNSKPIVVIDCSQDGENPDGAVVDSEGNIWNAQWGSARVACYNPNGVLVKQVHLSVNNPTCPAFAGKSNKLYCTSATNEVVLDEQKLDDGKTFEIEVDTFGQLEHQVIL